MKSSIKNIPIIILHGWGLNKTKYDELLAYFDNAGYTIESVDFPGFGSAPILKTPWSLSDYVDYLHTLLSNKKYNTVVFIGHSFGGRVALKYSELYPKDVRAVILSGTPGYLPINKLKYSISVCLSKIGKFICSIYPLCIIEDSIRLKFYTWVGVKDYMKANPIMRNTFKNVVQESLIGPMKSVSCPLLLLWGECDQIVPYRIAVQMHETIKGSRLVSVKGADHGVPYRSAKLFFQNVEKFLSTI